MQVQQVRQHIAPTQRLRAARVGQHGCHFGVGQPCMRVDDGWVKLVGVNLAIGGDHHVAGHGQALDVGVQRAQAIGQFLGQHGNHAAREVDRGGALVGVVIQRFTRFDVMTDVGNGHNQAPAFHGTFAAPQLDGFAVHGVVEVTRIFTVNGDQGHIAQVNPLLAVGRPYAVGQRRRLSQRWGRELVRHLVLAHGDFDLHAGVVDFTQDFCNPSHGLRVHGGRLGQFNRNHLPHAGTGRGVLGDQDVLPITAVFRCHQPVAAFVQQAPDDGRLAALDDVEHAALGSALAVQLEHPHADLVSVQHAAHFLRRQVDAGVSIDGVDKAVAIAVAFNDAFDVAHKGWSRLQRA